MTDYLSGAETTATVPGMRVICRYLLTRGPANSDQIALALRPPGAQEVSRTILDGSLLVARDLGLVNSPEAKGGSWALTRIYLRPRSWPAQMRFATECFA